jgi:hypothetical protein
VVIPGGVLHHAPDGHVLGLGPVARGCQVVVTQPHHVRPSRLVEAVGGGEDCGLVQQGPATLHLEGRVPPGGWETGAIPGIVR